MGTNRTGEILVRNWATSISLTAALLNFPASAQVVDLPIIGLAENLNISPSALLSGGTSSFPPEGTPASFGSGWDSISSTVLGKCVVDDKNKDSNKPSNPNVGSQDVNYEATLITSLSHMREVLNISASASFSYGIYSAGGNYSLFKDDTVNSYSSYMFLSVNVLNETQTLSRMRLADGRAAQLNDNPAAFAKACGDQYVASELTGGIFTAVVKIESKTEAHQQAISAAMNGAMAGFGKASGSIDKQFASLQNMGKVTIKVIRKGADGPIPDLKDINQYALDFPAKVAEVTGKPRRITAITLPYSTVENLPRGKSPYVYSLQNSYLAGLATLRDTSQQKKNDLLFVHANISQFDGQNRKDVQKNIDKLNEHLSDIRKAADACSNDPDNQCGKPYPKVDDIEIPTRKTTAASDKIKLSAELFENRGDPAKVTAALAVIQSVNEGEATQDEFYRTVLLKAEILDWQASRSGIAPASYKKELINTYVNTLAKAQGIASAMQSRPCEADYLAYVVDYLEYNNKTTLIEARNRFDALEKRLNKDGVSCKNYLWGGLDRWGAWIRLAQTTKDEGRSALENDELKREAAEKAEAAFNAEPNYFPNVYVWMAVHSDPAAYCKIFNDYLQRPTPSHLQGWEPLISNFKKDIVAKSDVIDLYQPCRRFSN